MSRSIESIASLVKKEIFLGSLHGNHITEAMSGQSVSVYSAESLMFIYGMLPQNNELWPSRDGCRHLCLEEKLHHHLVVPFSVLQELTFELCFLEP